MADLSSLSVDEIFKLLESNNSDVVAEIQRFFHENLSETRESWLVAGLYDYYSATASGRGMRLLANVREPHDKILCDRLADGLRAGAGAGLSLALDLLGYIVRKQPTWLHRVAHHQMFKDLLRLLKTETDVTVLVSALLVLVSLLPAVAHKVAPLLSELFETFHRLCVYKHKENSNLSELSSTHLMVALYSYFHRLYGMFPCNFLSSLRQQDYDTSCSGVFTDIVCPLLSTVRLHPLLVTHNREHEKTNTRWKGLAEVHDVLAECSRYSVDVCEAGSREEAVMGLWADPGSTPAPRPALASLTSTKLSLDSPPEAAVEATPDNTPYTTPVKDPARPPPLVPAPSSLHVRNLSFRSPGPGPASPTKSVTSPTKESSPFKFPEQGERRDSLFGDINPAHSSVNKRDSLGLGIPSLRVKSLSFESKSVETEPEASRPSPVKFTSVPPQLQLEHARYNMEKAKLLSVTEPQLAADTDAEVSSITGSGAGPHLTSRHITPQMFPVSDSANTSRTISRMSEEGESSGQDKCTEAGGRHSKETVSQLVTKVMRRVRRITLCDPADTLAVTTDRAAAEAEHEEEAELPRRWSSCPDITLELSVATPSLKQTQGHRHKLRFSSGTQTEPTLNILPYETLFPFALPLQQGTAGSKSLPPPQKLLDIYIDTAATTNYKDLNAQIQMLRSQLLFETGRRETLGARNRRLLGFTKNVRELEEQNLALVDKLHMAQQEIATLHTQLAKVRTGKHQAETERAEAGKLQDHAIQELQAKVQELKTSNRELTENYEFKEMQLLESNASCDKARSELFQAQAKLSMFQKKEEAWQLCQGEYEKLKVKFVLQGELVIRQKDTLDTIPRAAREEEIKMLQLASSKEIESLKATVISKSQELTAVRARTQELETKVADLTEGVAAQQKMIENIHAEYTEKLGAVECRARAVRSINSHLETTIMELQARMDRVARHRPGAGGGRRAGTSPSTDSIDMMVMSNISNSLGSDTGEHIRRAMDSPPVNLGREILGLEIPQHQLQHRASGGSVTVGSAYSAVGASVLQNSHNSQNGNSH